MARSNGFAFQIIDAAPLEDAGFEIQVIHQRDWERLCKARALPWVNSPLAPGEINDKIYRSPQNVIKTITPQEARPIAVISRFVNVMVGIQLNDVGTGSVTLDMDDALWAGTLDNGEPATTLLEYEHLWQVYENGALRGAFLGQQISEDILPAGSETIRAVTISGPGPADTLRWGVVMTSFFPEKTPETMPDGTPMQNPYNFKRITRMGAWKILLADAQKRGTDTFVCPNFTKDFDSGGLPWPDQPTPLPDPNIVTKVVTDGDHILFFPDSYELSDAAAGYLATFCDQMKKLAAPQVTIVGHTDSTNTNSYNMVLSRRRAQSVAQFIKGKVPHAVITAYGRGELEPVADNRTIHGRELNRRVVVTYPVAPDDPVEVYFGAAAGRNLLEVLQDWTGQNADTACPLRAEWFMQANFRLDVRLSFGTRREKEVVFYEGSITTVSKSRDRRRADIRNMIAGQDTKGVYFIKVDAESLKRWRQREVYMSLAANEDPTVVADIVQANLELQKSETAEWTIAVPAYAEGRRVFEDYSLGDWVGISRFLGNAENKVEAFRVMAITLSVANDNQVKLELTLQSTIESYLYRLKQRLSTFLTNYKTTKVFIQDEVPPNAAIGDLWTPLTVEDN